MAAKNLRDLGGGVIEEDGKSFLVPSTLRNGRWEPNYDGKVELPIPITSGLHIHYDRTPVEKPTTLFQKILSFLFL